MDPTPVDNRRRPGYEYRHQIEIDEGRVNTNRRVPLRGRCEFEFQIQTNFILKPRDPGAGETTLSSETISDPIFCCDHKYELCPCSRLRMREYWMTEAHIQEIIHETRDLCRSTELSTADRDPRVIPVTVRIGVCTVQQDGEGLDAAVDRAITVPNLMAMRVGGGLYKELGIALAMFVMKNMGRSRLEDVGLGLGLMRSCPICERAPTLGAQLLTTVCGHTFHSHCIVGSLRKKNSCPVCNVPVYDENPYLKDLFQLMWLH
ncbi:RING/U-box superfamily protein [Striga hermonthica]|uniref:RING-type E3 ubiquitin transferase n=1 Tax=Striga hermonthica TaxID=68872 RepID=A0A9N7P3E4_STRHE|nr:RING/U-box superfamily protein [Striga hermonthica]